MLEKQLTNPDRLNFNKRPKAHSVGALIIRIGFWGPLYYNYYTEPPVLEIIEAPIVDPLPSAAPRLAGTCELEFRRSESGTILARVGRLSV